MKNTPFILLLLGVMFIWLGLTGRLGAVLAAIFEPGKLVQGGDGSGYSAPPPIPGTGSNPFYNDPLTIPQT